MSEEIDLKDGYRVISEKDLERVVSSLEKLPYKDVYGAMHILTSLPVIQEKDAPEG